MPWNVFYKSTPEVNAHLHAILPCYSYCGKQSHLHQYSLLQTIECYHITRVVCRLMWPAYLIHCFFTSLAKHENRVGFLGNVNNSLGLGCLQYSQMSTSHRLVSTSAILSPKTIVEWHTLHQRRCTLHLHVHTGSTECQSVNRSI